MYVRRLLSHGYLIERHFIRVSLYYFIYKIAFSVKIYYNNLVIL
nr:MAG TPA: hypothetical protein [Caudoviricetes sp.]